MAKTLEQVHLELIAELRLQDCITQADAFEMAGARESELWLAGVGMTLNRALEKLQRPVILSEIR